jgi:cytochrome c peroxidase
VFTTDGTTPTAQALELPNMSAASQATGPVLSIFEMACANETFPALGRSLMAQRVLQTQPISPTDSVFSALPVGGIASGGLGLTVTYSDLVRAAFQPAYWQDNHFYSVNSSTGQISPVPDASTGFLIDELNFSMYFGMAIDAYERTLISDKSPFDLGTMTADAVAGEGVFTGKAHCDACHDGPLFSKATTFQGDTAFAPILNMQMADGGGSNALYDNGFYNIGVRPAFEDRGVGSVDAYNNPLSFTRQYVTAPGSTNVGLDQFSVPPCTSGSCTPLPTTVSTQTQRVAVDGAFKVPSLRNVALTPPYFHNGGQRSLADVIAFYNRGGDRRTLVNGDTTGTGTLGRPVATTTVTPQMGGSNMDPQVTSLSLTATQQTQLVAFLQALTDPRVACHAAPFDHPGLTVANGQVAQDANNDGNADDSPTVIREVGATGYSTCQQLYTRLNAGDLFLSSPAFDAMKTRTSGP